MSTLAQQCHIDADQAKAIRDVGYDLLEAGDASSAARLFEALTQLNPYDVNALLGLGAALEAAGEPALALDAYQSATQVAGDEPAVRLKLGELKLKRGDASGLGDLRAAASAKSPVGRRAAALLAAATTRAA